MKRIISTVIKEWQVTRRDWGGIALLFAMPVLLIIIMALVQDAPFRDYRNVVHHALLINQDKGKVASLLVDGLNKNKAFILHDSLQGKVIEVDNAKQLVKQGKYPFAILMPSGLSAEIVNSANAIANGMAKKIGMPSHLPERELRTGHNIQLIFDPTAKPTFKLAVQNALEKFLSRIQSDIILDRIARLNASNQDSSSFDFDKHLHAVTIEELSLQAQDSKLKEMNSVQHNVPAWAIFGIFFLTVIISESLIQERSTGSWTRIKLIPGSIRDILIGKMIFFIVLGVLQFLAMLLVGVFVMPLFGLPSLQLSDAPLQLLVVLVCIATSATCTGILIGFFFNTTKQALPFAALIIVILSAIGGIWVPLEVLPSLLKTVSVLSPMRWSLEGVNQVLLRQSGWIGIVKPCIILVFGSLVSLLIAQQLERRRVH
ncbi:MAG: ABC transporter permease [Chitinophagaceae bacterium]|nr:ABC transporter permease [Chitinophagaceae bacterium]